MDVRVSVDSRRDVAEGIRYLKYDDSEDVDPDDEQTDAELGSEI